VNNDGMDKVIEILKEKDFFLITAHINPEGDSIGSQLALSNLLERLNKKHLMVNRDAIPDNLKFLPGVEKIIFSMPEHFQPQVALVLDCPVKRRVGTVEPAVDKADVVVNIDHHVSNEFFGDINWVEAEMSSIGEMIYHLYEKIGVEIDKDTAIAMYSAILTDTGMFNYDNTSGKTHQIAGKLLEKGIDPSSVFNEIYEKKSFAQIRILGKVLSGIQIEEEGKIAYMSLTSDMYAEESVNDVSTEEFINYLRSIKGVEVAIFFKQNPDNREIVDVSFRSSGDVDVNMIASRLGGGGHKRASGCKLTCGLDEAKKEVLQETRKAVRAE